MEAQRRQLEETKRKQKEQEGVGLNNIIPITFWMPMLLELDNNTFLDFQALWVEFPPAEFFFLIVICVAYIYSFDKTKRNCQTKRGSSKARSNQATSWASS